MLYCLGKVKRDKRMKQYFLVAYAQFVVLEEELSTITNWLTERDVDPDKFILIHGESIPIKKKVQFTIGGKE